VDGPEAELSEAGQQRITRQAPGGLGRARRATPSGRCSPGAAPSAPPARRRAARRSRPEDVGQAERQLGGEERLADERDARDGDAQQEEEPEPDGCPSTAATVDSIAAISETCPRVAPARRIAANRSSRRAADSRVAVPMKISTGVKIARATTARMRSMELDRLQRRSEIGQALGVRHVPAMRAIARRHEGTGHHVVDRRHLHGGSVSALAAPACARRR